VSNRCQPVANGAKAIEIGSSGGTVTSSDGKISMDIPAGAIDGSIVFSVKAATAWPSGAVGQVYEVEPSGTQFSKPATIALSYAGLNIDAATAAQLFVGTAVGASWQSLGTAVNDTRAQTVASTTTHLSVFGLVAFASSADAGVDIGGNGGGSSGQAGGAPGQGGAANQAGNPGAGGSDNFGGRSNTAGGGAFPGGGTATIGFGGFPTGGTMTGGGAATGSGGFPAGGTTSSGGRPGSGGFTQTSGGAGFGGFASGGVPSSGGFGGFGGFASGGVPSSGGFGQTGGFGGVVGTATVSKDAGIGGLVP
jgi:hypothetical protein